jgi:hypothetical protein
MIRRMVGRAAALAALMVLPGAALADGPFCGFFQPRGGAYYSPLHYWAPAAYRVKFCLKGPDCPGSRVSVYPSPPPASMPLAGPAALPPAQAAPAPGQLP